MTQVQLPSTLPLRLLLQGAEGSSTQYAGNVQPAHETTPYSSLLPCVYRNMHKAYINAPWRYVCPTHWSRYATTPIHRICIIFITHASQYHPQFRPNLSQAVPMHLAQQCHDLPVVTPRAAGRRTRLPHANLNYTGDSPRFQSTLVAFYHMWSRPPSITGIPIHYYTSPYKVLLCHSFDSIRPL